MSYLKRLLSLPTSKYAVGTTHTIPARTGVAVPLRANHSITVTNTHGTQVVDTWFLSVASTSSAGKRVPASHVSMCHTRASNLRLSPRPGDVLMSNHRAPMVVFEEDSSSSSTSTSTDAGVGVHDTLIAACDLARYHELGVPEHTFHDSCAENFRRALRRDLDLSVDEVGDDVTPPDPLNLWMNIPVTPNEVGIDREVEGEETVSNVSAGARVSFERPVSRKGDWVRLRALVDGVVVMSACPQDILRINDLKPVDAAFRVDEAS